MGRRGWWRGEGGGNVAHRHDGLQGRGRRQQPGTDDRNGQVARHRALGVAGAIDRRAVRTLVRRFGIIGRRRGVGFVPGRAAVVTGAIPGGGTVWSSACWCRPEERAHQGDEEPQP